MGLGALRSLSARHRPRILAHLLALPAADRYLRFGYAASDVQVARYVDGLDFQRDEVFGIFGAGLSLTAMAHLANTRLPQSEGGRPVAEFGVSVSGRARGRRYGSRLFKHAVLHARNHGASQLFIHALSENAVMLRIARNAGAVVRRDGCESEAWLQLPRDSLTSQLDEVVQAHVAETHYRLRFQWQRVLSVLAAIQEVRAQLSVHRDRAPIAHE